MSGLYYPLKSVLKKDEVYTITKCSISITMNSLDMYHNYVSNIMRIDVKPSSGGETIETCFRDEVINRLLKFCDTNPKYCSVVVPGVKFLYGGEVTSEAGDTYSDVQFLNIQSLQEPNAIIPIYQYGDVMLPTVLSDETINLQQRLDAICIDDPMIRKKKKVTFADTSTTLPWGGVE